MDVAELFFEIDDPRQEGKCFHQLTDILMIVLCGYLADCEGFEEVYDYACDKQEVFREFLELPCGIPSHDTLNRVFRRLEPTQLETLLTNWGKEIVDLLTQKQLIIDGKQLRGTVEAGHKQATVQIVSVWAEKERLCLAQSQIATKTNEIKAIPDLLKSIDIASSVVSMDAIGCQKTIAKLIIDQRADYLIGLKANQDGLYEQVVDWFERTKPSLQADISRDLGHGRAEKRAVFVSETLDLIDAAAGWVGLKSVIYVESTRWINDKEQRSTRYYISSLRGYSAAQMSCYIRRHWSIENEQHWHLDVTFDEDGCQVRKDHAPRNLSTVRKLALGLISRDPAKMSLKRKRKKAARDDAYLMTLLSQLNV
ncbi:ISAs1 family transposase [Spirosoma foliorum]|uniref:ISAs1 family transposase n=1 Tax=Spirosoma foliorum TaxID=2710596 RepID=A0A7G5GZ69_9BACT|nr:ISAs1 family transposase [Spirosoma foliorum]QMW02696.1 ISAs1 family transposase [Spirosoma foliorum]QMW03338.1 ISAs1 family transposase [Spirosoma foliorum]QMW04161.1 ISAs1 family transposase [Spirosoma foliorum]QMW04970.1 ISAs1 family transposase [Spirosoma foliorum]